MHTDHSHDCATPVYTLLESARVQGLGAIAITDHNEISGAPEARGCDRRRIRRQGDPRRGSQNRRSRGGNRAFHQAKDCARDDARRRRSRRSSGKVDWFTCRNPFDRMHSVPAHGQNLLKVIEDIDAIEVFNPRVAFSAFNEEAVRFAAKYRIVAGAGSDSHVAQGLGSVRKSTCMTSTDLRSFSNHCATRTSRARRPPPALRAGAEVSPDQRARSSRDGGSQEDAGGKVIVKKPAGTGCRPPTTRFARSTSSARSAS